MSGFVSLEPVNTKTSNGNTYEDHYDYNKVHIGDIPDDLSVPNGVRFEKVGNIAIWKYKSKHTVVLTEDGAKVLYSNVGKEARNQAYFALSVLADKGYVSRWRKK
jgi:hypothetical protein